jgi:hypothetical protein
MNPDIMVGDLRFDGTGRPAGDLRSVPHRVLGGLFAAMATFQLADLRESCSAGHSELILSELW